MGDYRPIARQRARRPALFSAEGAQWAAVPPAAHPQPQDGADARRLLPRLVARRRHRLLAAGRRLLHADPLALRTWGTAPRTAPTARYTDFVRSAAEGGGVAQLLLTGSYDHTVVLWDVHAAGGGVMTLRHAAPVEAVVALPGGGLVATASGATLTLWDILSGGRVYDHSTCAVIASLKYAAPLLALALSPSGSHLVVGQSDSTLCVRTRKSAAPPPPPSDEPYGPRGGRLPGQVVDPPRREGERPGTYRYFLRGRQHAPQPVDRAVEPSAAPRLSTFDKALKSFRYHEAFDAALKATAAAALHALPRSLTAAEVVVSVVEELVQRNGLRIALQGRDHHTLQPVVAFLARQITSPPYSQVLIGVANLLLDMYAPVLGQSPTIDELFVKLRNVLEAEVRLQAELAQLMGAMDELLPGAVPTWTALAGRVASPQAAEGCRRPSDS
ncbi:hypothetical protein AB1Y20_020675 [Prymnesium parvum]|uniref:U3 small nucleolar RNA-associated protein 15 C-terminal domain-containing protein n=1 Tax=Prymnesium parvum TaxID=97485 RepID=A0AB34JVB3_PRYPA